MICVTNQYYVKAKVTQNLLLIKMDLFILIDTSNVLHHKYRTVSIIVLYGLEN